MMGQPALEQIISSAVQARGLHGSSRSARQAQPPMEHMEAIPEERSELAMDIAQAVVEKLDIDRKLDERMKELMMKGDRVFKDIQIRQEQSTESLCRTVGMCLESQRAFQEEHQRLLVAVKQLATMVIPHTDLGNQAMEAQARGLEASARASAMVEETEALQKQMEDHRLSAACAAAAVVTQTLTTTAPALVNQTVSAPTAPAATTVQPGAGTFSITLRKADEVSLGLSVNPDENEEKTLIVEGVLPGGAVESWNRQCFGDATGERVVVAGDRIVRVNGIDGDVKKMLEECTKSRLVKLVIARGTASAQTRFNATIGGSGQSEATQASEPAARASTLRTKAPEFVPSGTDAPLQQTQILAAPPGLFFHSKNSSNDDNTATAKDNANALVAGVLSSGYSETVNTQDLDDSDKEN